MLGHGLATYQGIVERPVQSADGAVQDAQTGDGTIVAIERGKHAEVNGYQHQAPRQEGKHQQDAQAS